MSGSGCAGARRRFRRLLRFRLFGRCTAGGRVFRRRRRDSAPRGLGEHVERALHRVERGYRGRHRRLTRCAPMPPLHVVANRVFERHEFVLHHADGIDLPGVVRDCMLRQHRRSFEDARYHGHAGQPRRGIFLAVVVTHGRKAQQLLQRECAALEIERADAHGRRIRVDHDREPRTGRRELPLHGGAQLPLRFGWQKQRVDDQRQHNCVVDRHPHPQTVTHQRFRVIGPIGKGLRVNHDQRDEKEHQPQFRHGPHQIGAAKKDRACDDDAQQRIVERQLVDADDAGDRAGRADHSTSMRPGGSARCSTA